ncbi:MAG: VCBS repeat-containing protein [Chitinophagaceae bacterium]|nr:VCBS repeat-containing protein [Chitinophagaceae bacterium]
MNNRWCTGSKNKNSQGLVKSQNRIKIAGNWHWLISGFLLVALFSCGKKNKSGLALFTRLNDSGINFTNTVIDSKKDNSFLFRNFYNGGGVAIGDINNDSLCDVILTSNQGENKLYLNKGGLKFEDITAASGMKQDSMWSTGVVMADINNDGWLDIYVCNSGRLNDGNRRNKLYINKRNNSFSDSAAAYGLDHSGFCTQATFFDYDLDGDLDCLIINNSPLPFSSLNYAGMRDTDIAQWEVDESMKGGGNHLFRNDNNHFSEVTKEAGLHTGLISFGLGVSVGDINGDNYPDIYVGNDFIEKDYLYLNQKNGTFKDKLEESIQQISMSSMSTDLADINNDGFPEIFTTDMIPDDDYRLKTTGTFDNIDLYYSKLKQGLYHQYVKNALQLNNKNGTFTEISNYSKVFGTDWSWGSLFFDADNDGYNDLFICNGINKDLGDLDFLDFFSNDVYQKMVQTGRRDEIDEILRHIPVTPLANRVFRNEGNLNFRDVANEWGLGEPSFSNSVAYGDLDNDGDLDLVVNNENQASFVYRNNSREQNGNSYMGFVLKGLGGNGYAIGSKISVYRGGQVYYRELVPSRGFQSSVDYKQLVGLGKEQVVDSVVITWPDGGSSTYKGLAVNKVHHLQEPATGKQRLAAAILPSPMLDKLGIKPDKHQEDEYIDFYYERNLPAQLSREGPKIATGDVNGDGKEDMYIGGGRGQAGQLYLQTATGFEKKEEETFRLFSDLEDVAVLFFDADKDKDLDLYVGAGGNYMTPGSREAQHRLYKNDGQGNFTIDYQSFPNNDMNIAVAVNYDYDGDGDEDLYVGSRSVPYHYGESPQSYIYNNDGSGHFSDVTAALSKELPKAGMITGARWADVTGDGKKELIIVGEWMNPQVYSYNAKTKKLEQQPNTGLEQLQGWWQTVEAADVNGDGKTDLVLGNIGENFYLRPDEKNPVKLWLNDFDGSGTMDQFLTRSVSGRDMPVFLKREITDQFPALKKQNLKHSEYAKRSVQDLFGGELIKKSEVKTFSYCKSVIALNEGGGRFRVEVLPVWVQLSGVNAALVSDLNADGRADLVLGGNLYTFPPQFGRLDGSYGHVLLNGGVKGGKQQWEYMESGRSGVQLRGEVKDIRRVGTDYLVAVINNEQPVVYRIKK